MLYSTARYLQTVFNLLSINLYKSIIKYRKVLTMYPLTKNAAFVPYNSFNTFSDTNEIYHTENWSLSAPNVFVICQVK